MLVPVFGISTVHLECLQEALEPSSSLAQALFPSARPVGPFSRPSGKGRAAEVPCAGGATRNVKGVWRGNRAKRRQELGR